MDRSIPKSRFGFALILVFILAAGLFAVSNGYSQNQRNPVLEFCTGTWCQWCPCGDSIIINNIMPNIPNAIILAYHGAGSDPFRLFAGSSIISNLLYDPIGGGVFYPTGAIDRVSGIQDRGAWYANLNARLGVAAGVEIKIVSRSYDPVTREFNAIIDITALKNLSGEFNYNVLLVEDGIIYGQTSNNTCTPGTTYLPGYIHEWLVRDMMAGASGAQIVNGTWNTGEKFTKNVQYTIPVPASPAPDIVPDNCHIVVMVNKVGSPLNANAEIQQAEEWPLIPLDYTANMVTGQTDVVGSTSTPSQFSATLLNTGILPDTYYIELSFDGPGAWNQTFTTVNGTHPIGAIDSIAVNPGDSTIITVSVDPNSIVGFGKATLHFDSKNSPSAFGSIEYKLATFGLKILVVDDDQTETYENYIITALDNLAEPYGVVSASAIPPAATNLSTIGSLMWLTGLSEPGLNADEMNALITYLDGGGNLYLSGVDIPYQLADPQSPYYTTNSLDFFNNYLHASYVTRYFFSLAVDGVTGDPITDGFATMNLSGGTGANNLGASSGKYPSEITAGDTSATNIFTFWLSSGNVAGIRANHNNGKVIFSTFGFEAIADDANRTLLADRILDWFSPATGIGDDDGMQIVKKFELSQNYPNPFNPETRIRFALPTSENGSRAELVIYDQLGQKVRTLINENKSSGRYEITWNGMDDHNNPAASSIYFYQLRYGKYTSAKKMVLLR